VKARNAGEETAFDKAVRERKEKKKEDTKAEAAEAVGASESEEEEEKPAAKPAAKRTGVAGIAVENPNAVKRNEERDGVELTRKQREELEKAAAQRRYQELHKAGKTDEAKADLARLEEVKKRREEAAQKKAAQEAELKAKEEEAKKKTVGKTALISELKGVMGGGESNMRGHRSKKNAEKDEKDKPEAKKKEGDESDDDGVTFAEEPEPAAKSAPTGGYPSAKSAEAPKAPKERPVAKPKVMDQSIEACRAAEDDFM